MLYNITVNKKEKTMKTINGKNKTERMISKPLKYMGLVVTDSSSNKHMYATIESGDFNKYAYYCVYETPYNTATKTSAGKTINKFYFHIDNFDNGSGYNTLFVPTWMVLELVNGDVREKAGYLVALERNQWNNETIKKLNDLNDGADSIKVLNPENIKDLKYHY